MGYFKNLWSALIGTSNKKVVKKDKYAPAKEKIIKIEINLISTDQAHDLSHHLNKTRFPACLVALFA